VKDEDIESGNGSSLSQSPQHVSIPIPGTGMEKFKKTLRMSSDQIVSSHKSCVSFGFENRGSGN